MFKLNSKKRRVDLEIYNEATSFFVSNGGCKGQVDCEPAGLAKACRNKQLLVVELNQDDGFIARVVLGEMNKQEREEWISTGSRLLDLADGELVVSAGNAYVSNRYTAEEIDADEGEFFEKVQIRPGKYFVSVFTHLPSVNGDLITRSKGWDGFVPWFNETRPRKKMPDWLIEMAESEGEDTDAEAEEEDERVSFVIQLLPAEASMKQSRLAERYLLKMKMRRPEKCPLGISPVGIESDKMTDEEFAELEKKETEERTARFGDPKDLASFFKPYAEAMYEGRFEDAADFFVKDARAEALKYINDNRLFEGHPLAPVNRVWLDKEPASQALSRWQRINDEGDSIVFEPTAVNESSFLGEIRCEFGISEDYIEGKVDRYVIVDSVIAKTKKGPRLVGVCFLD